jgi:hypothetical protein
MGCFDGFMRKIYSASCVLASHAAGSFILGEQILIEVRDCRVVYINHT